MAPTMKKEDGVPLRAGLRARQDGRAITAASHQRNASNVPQRVEKRRPNGVNASVSQQPRQRGRPPVALAAAAALGTQSNGTPPRDSATSVNAAAGLQGRRTPGVSPDRSVRAESTPPEYEQFGKRLSEHMEKTRNPLLSLLRDPGSFSGSIDKLEAFRRGLEGDNHGQELRTSPHMPTLNARGSPGRLAPRMSPHPPVSTRGRPPSLRPVVRLQQVPPGGTGPPPPNQEDPCATQ